MLVVGHETDSRGHPLCATLPSAMLALIAFVFIAAQEPAKPADLSVIEARLGPCAADFTVTGADGKPVYAATIHVRIRYGFLSLSIVLRIR